MDLQYQILIAFILDLLIGDPPGYPHPVRLIGAGAARLEPLTRRYFPSERVAGTVTVIIVLLCTFSVCWGWVAGLSLLHPLAGTAGSIFLIYTSISVRCLFDESRPVLHHLRGNRLDQARLSLGKIVGRDTAQLDEREVLRATVETVAESIGDGIIAPLLYASLGGAPLAIAYKAVNTMDSMFGYKNEKYLWFGRTAARLDDWVNWVPARISGLLIALAAPICGLNGKDALSTLIRDGRKHLSPNAGIPEAAVAGALGIALGGTNYYSGMRVEKPVIGISKKEIEHRDITRSHQIMFTASILAMAFFIIVRELLN